MNILEVIEKKRDKKELTKEEISFFIKGYTEGSVTDYQAAALIMAIYLNGMTNQECTYLTMEMAHSGDILDLSKIEGIIVDKHSTGGVGDKVSIILLPLISSLGVKVAKMSGRGLGFTGGTVDKMESIPGYRTEITEEEFIKNVQKIGISMISQTRNLAPADKKIYALRDSISCVESIPLIASSIMSKKIASGAQKIMLEVTYGKGAFMKTKEKAKELAEQMVKIGELAKRETTYILTDMNQPLGYAIGNTLEMIEAIRFLKGEELPEDLKNVVLDLGANMIKLAGLGENIEENKNKMIEQLHNGQAFNKFKEMVELQGGDISYLEDTNKFEKSKYQYEIKSPTDGKIEAIPADIIAKYVCNLGAGRIKKEDKIDMSVGIVLSKKVGDTVYKDEKILTIYANSPINNMTIKDFEISII